MRVVVQEAPFDLGAEAEAFAAYLEANAPIEAVSLWSDSRAAVLAMTDSSPAAHDFMQLTIECLLQALWTKIADKADAHPDPARIRRVAATALRRGLVRAKAAASLVSEAPADAA